MDSSDSSKTSKGVKSRILFFEDTVRKSKKQERTSYKQVEDNFSEKSRVRREHSEYIRSCFDIVKNENELIQKHERNKKLLIDNYIAGISVDDEEEKVKTKQLCDDIDRDFKGLLSDYKASHKVSILEQNQALENSKSSYIKEMDKHFKKLKFIFAKELEDLHKVAKSLSHNLIETELSPNPINTKLEEQFNNSIEKIYDHYKRQSLENIPLKPAIGIDLGTTYSCVGVMKRGKVQIISNNFGLNTFPSYIAFTSIGEPIVGQTAKEQSHENPVNTVYDVKRMIGRKYNDIYIQKDKKLWPFEVLDENGSLKVRLYCNDCVTLFPEELSSEILSKLKKEAEDFLGFEVKNAVITVPAYFNDAQRQATKEAGILAGLHVLQILNEPTAAAIAYSHQIKDDFSKTVLIYDLGGGTFDVSIVVIDNEYIDVRAVGGDTHLGGVDFDQRIIDHIFKTFNDKFNEVVDEKAMKRALSRLKIYCEKKKWDLSGSTSTNISIDVLLPGWDFKYELTRDVFEDLCADLFEKTIKIVDATLKKAQIEANDIHEIVLIGGSTKIPKIQTLLLKYFKDKPLNKEVKPDEAVAYGATVQAALLNGEKFFDSNLAFIRDVAPFSLGIEVLDKSMAIIIPCNTKIPTEKKQVFKTVENYQNFVKIQIFEGDNKIAKLNNLLGDFVIDGLPKKRAGKVTVEVTIKIDEEGIMHIDAVTPNKSTSLVLTEHRGRIAADELRKLSAKAYKEK